ncbi:MAG: orotidine-5'-phosphate decarboxylase [Prochlorothrix sp.]|nr:orotidine-5'-phosphate decarboxylase [Prochlorothrix sp.]
MTTLTADRRIIVPLDVPNLDQAKALVDQLPQVKFWKVGLELFVAGGGSIVAFLKERQCRVFLDLKFHDIPNTMAGACAAAATYGVDLLTVHAPAGREALAAAQAAADRSAQAAGYASPCLLAVTLLTSLNSRHLAFDLKIALDPQDYVQQMALLAQDSGIGGVVCSPQEIEAVRQVCPAPFTIVCPGVRPAGSQVGDQQRTLTPGAALKAGADYLVIGRPITQAPDPAAAFGAICDELQAVL